MEYIFTFIKKTSNLIIIDENEAFQGKYFAKINSTESILIENELLKEIEENFPLKIEKNDEKSLKIRIEGNTCFGKKNYLQALELYNKSICFAERNSINIPIGYANRSAVLYELKFYKECLENIEMAKNANLPPRLVDKVLKRENESKVMLSKMSSPIDNDVLQLSYSVNKDAPFFVECLEVKQTKNMGWGVFTKKALKPGDLISKEKVFSSVITDHMKYMRCSNCCKQNFMTLLPCQNCTSTMFCNENCQNEAYSKFHQYECSIINFLLQFFPPYYMEYVLALRTTLNLFKDLNSKCNLDYERKSNMFENNEFFNEKNNIAVINSLIKHPTFRNTKETLIITAILKYLLFSKTDLKMEHEESKKIIIDLLIQNYLAVCSNAFHYNNQISYLFGFGSIFNHSCCPNVRHFLNGNDGYFFVLRCIEENEQVFVSYGQDFRDTPKEKRTETLRKLWNFECKCKACENDYESSRIAVLKYHTTPKRRVYSQQFEELIKSINNYNNNEQKILNIFHNCCKFLTKYSDFYPDGPIIHIETELCYFLKLLVDGPQTNIIKGIKN